MPDCCDELQAHLKGTGKAYPRACVFSYEQASETRNAWLLPNQMVRKQTRDLDDGVHLDRFPSRYHVDSTFRRPAEKPNGERYAHMHVIAKEKSTNMQENVHVYFSLQMM